LRIDAFIALPFESLERMSLLNRLKEIGELEGSTHKRPDVA
jgi:arsenate reductase (thioredoxin)